MHSPSEADAGALRTRIGVLLPELDGEYFRPLVDGVCRQAAIRGVDLVFYPGHLPGTPIAFEQQLGAVFDLVDSTAVDGLLIFASTLQVHLDDAAMHDFLSRYRHMPAVCIGYEFEDWPAVMLDNYTGFKQLVEHFIVVHGHTRIAMIEGPAGNRDAQERLRAYLDAHAGQGLVADPALRVEGNFSQYATGAAMDALWSACKPFTAVVCANDEMAHGALAAAVDHGIGIPDGLAIGGFDDLLSIYQSGPSLTTVNQAVDTQGASALDLLLEGLRGEDVPQITPIATRLVLRRSCGCAGAFGAIAGAVSKAEQAHTLAAAMNAPAPLHERLSFDLLVLRDALLLDDGGTRFEESLTQLATRWVQHHGDVSALQQMLLGIRHQLPGPVSAESMAEAADRLQRGQIVLANAMELSQNRRQVLSTGSALDYRNEFKARVTTDNLDELLGALGHSLRKLGVDTCFIALYREPLTLEQMRTEGIPSSSRLIFAMHEGIPQPQWVDQDFQTPRLAPVNVSIGAEANVRVVLPMFYLQEHFGFIVVDRQPDGGLHCEDLRHELSTYIHHCLLVRDLAKARDLLRSDLARAQRDNEALSHMAMRDELTGLFNRRGFFELAHTLLGTARLTGKPVTLIFADLDGLKPINDVHGHEEGDLAIREAGKLLRNTFRQDDIVSRIGGDEFVVLTRIYNLDSMPEIERRLARAFDDYNAQSGKAYTLGCSIGGYVIPVDSKESLDDVLAQADRLLYAAKRRKRALREGRTSKF